MFEAEAEAKILASRPLWPRGLNITAANTCYVCARTLIMMRLLRLIVLLFHHPTVECHQTKYETDSDYQS